MSEKLEMAEKELKSVKTKYESLKKASGSLLALQEAHDKTLKESQEARLTLETLQKENMILNVFPAKSVVFDRDAVVLLVGLIFSAWSWEGNSANGNLLTIRF